MSRRSALLGLASVGALSACGRASSDALNSSSPTVPRTPAQTRPAAAASRTEAGTESPTPTETTEQQPTEPPAEPLPSLDGDTDNTWAFAPLSDPGAVVVEGSTATQQAWSTSKVLVLSAFLQHRSVASLDDLRATDRSAFIEALDKSDMPSLLHLRRQVPNRGAAMTAILRSIGDTTTIAPDTKEGTMEWTVREQVRFMAALHAGRVVNSQISELIRTHLTPVPSQQWGLGTIGASAYKGGWLTPRSETRQMGIVDGYAVAILTLGVGPTILQSDGDDAHVEQMNTLAGMLRTRIDGA